MCIHCFAGYAYIGILVYVYTMTQQTYESEYEEYRKSLNQIAQSEEQNIVVQPYHLKYTATSKGYRVDVSVHTSTPEEARRSALALLVQARNDLRNSKIPIAEEGGRE